MKQLTSYVLALVISLVLLAAIAPSLIALTTSLIPLIVVVTVAVVMVRLAFFHTRRW